MGAGRLLVWWWRSVVAVQLLLLLFLLLLPLLMLLLLLLPFGLLLLTFTLGCFEQLCLLSVHLFLHAPPVRFQFVSHAL